MIVGSGDYRYRVNRDWAKLPESWSFKDSSGRQSCLRRCLSVRGPNIWACARVTEPW